MADILIWWAVVQLLGLLALPLAGWLFGALPDGGYALSKPFGLLLAGYLGWLLAMVGVGQFGRGLLVFCALLVAGGSALVWRGQLGRFPATARSWLARRWPLLLGYEALFFALLLFAALMRSVNPATWGTERPMDYAFFNAIQRSASFPPHDPWLSGYSINYYYFGYLLMGVLSLLSGRDPGVAFNLSLATLFAMTGLGAAGIVVNLVALARRVRVPGAQALLPGLLAVVLVLFAANQGGALQLASGTKMVVALRGSDMLRALQNGLGARQEVYLDEPFLGWDFNDTRVITPTSAAETAQNFDWWYSSRALWDDYQQPDGTKQRRYAITEFPFFSFWLGDMHPHVMALPFTLLALALALHTSARQAPPQFLANRRGWAELALIGVVLGSLYTINSWDFPTYLALFAGALLLAYVRQAGRLGAVRWQAYAGQLALVVAASVALFSPFYLTVRSLVGGKEPLVPLPIIGLLSKVLGVVTWDHTALQTFIIIFGTFFVPLLGMAVLREKATALASSGEATAVVADAAAAETAADDSGQQEGAASPSVDAAEITDGSWQPEADQPPHVKPPVLGTIEPAIRTRELPPRWLLWASVGTLAIGTVVGFPLLALLPFGIYVALLAAAHVEHSAFAFALWAFALICVVCFATDVVYIRDAFEGSSSRMNTIFKFYYQIWLVWGTLAAFAVWWLATRLRGRVRLVPLMVFVLLLLGGLTYPWFTANRPIRDLTALNLKGTTPRENSPAGAASINWLRQYAPRTAVVLEDTGQQYDGAGRAGVAAATGLQTVLGWAGHEQQWRGGDPDGMAQLGPRGEAVHTIYSTTDINQARSLLQQYKVNYIYVGQVERDTYSPDGLAKLAQLGQPVFQQDEVVIYQVN